MIVIDSESIRSCLIVIVLVVVVRLIVLVVSLILSVVRDVVVYARRSLVVVVRCARLAVVARSTRSSP